MTAPDSGEMRRARGRVADWDRKEPLLIHCRAGISRSTAAAFIAACSANPDVDEHSIARALRDAAPLARPNLFLVELADEVLGRRGRMRDAVVETGRDLPWIEIDENEPFSMASVHAPIP